MLAAAIVAKRGKGKEQEASRKMPGKGQDCAKIQNIFERIGNPTEEKHSLEVRNGTCVVNLRYCIYLIMNLKGFTSHLYDHSSATLRLSY